MCSIEIMKSNSSRQVIFNDFENSQDFFIKRDNFDIYEEKKTVESVMTHFQNHISTEKKVFFL